MLVLKKIRIGIFGLGRGSDYFDNIKNNNGEIVAVCDRNQEKLNNVLTILGDNTAGYTDFDLFVQHDMDAVYIANCFHEHTPFVIKCLEKDLNVLCECTSNATMGEGVAIVRAAKKSKGIYMLAENYPFMIFNREMKRIYDGGSLGKAIYAEGEYNHPFNLDDAETHMSIRPYSKHWRNYLPRTYYVTHSLAPLMYITGAMPKRVTAMPVYSPFDDEKTVVSPVADRAAIMTTLNDDGSVFKFTGCAAFGAHGNSYRICGQNGQIENIRGTDHKIMLRYNSWQIPQGREEVNYYTPEWSEDEKDFAEAAGHGGSDFFVIKEFFECIRKNKRPVFDEYFSTTMASVAILGHRSLLEKGVPCDIPDFRNEEDCLKWENDFSTPFFINGNNPDIPCCSNPDYTPRKDQIDTYMKLSGENIVLEEK